MIRLSRWFPILMGIWCLAAGSFATAPAALAVTADPAKLEAYAELLKAETDYQRMLIEARLADSQIRLEQAKIELKHELANHLRVLQRLWLLPLVIRLRL